MNDDLIKELIEALRENTRALRGESESETKPGWVPKEEKTVPNRVPAPAVEKVKSKSKSNLTYEKIRPELIAWLNPLFIKNRERFNTVRKILLDKFADGADSFEDLDPDACQAILEYIRNTEAK